jgi:hypothetical protein
MPTDHHRHDLVSEYDLDTESQQLGKGKLMVSKNVIHEVGNWIAAKRYFKALGKDAPNGMGIFPDLAFSAC